MAFGLLAHDIELSTKKGRGALNAKTRPFWWMTIYGMFEQREKIASVIIIKKNIIADGVLVYWFNEEIRVYACDCLTSYSVDLYFYLTI